MSEWVSKSLGDLAIITSGGTPSRTSPSYWNGEILWVTPTDITSCETNYLYDTAERISKQGLASSSAKLLPEGTLLFTSRATIGEMKIAGLPVSTNQGFKSLTAKQNVDSMFLFYQIQRIKKQFIRYGAGSTFLEINKKDTSRVKILHPTNKKYQKKIVEILVTIDQAIEKTEALIEKYQNIKAGLMQDLFTRGVTADGKLRPPREKAPELYQETPIGWIPKDWVFTTCSNVCEKVIDCKNRTPPITPDGYPVIRTPNVRNGEFVDKELVFTDYNSYVIWTARGKPQIGDIVITREAPVGEVCMIPGRHPFACLGQRVMLYRTDVSKIDSYYFLYALQSQTIQNRLDLISGGSTVGHVRVGDIRDLWMFHPSSRDEQVKISCSLRSISEKIENEKKQKTKLLMKKSGLMNDLLTGEVRLKPNKDQS